MDYEKIAKLPPLQRVKPLFVSLIPCVALCAVLFSIAFIAVETERQLHFRSVCAETGCAK